MPEFAVLKRQRQSRRPQLAERARQQLELLRHPDQSLSGAETSGAAVPAVGKTDRPVEHQ